MDFSRNRRLASSIRSVAAKSTTPCCRFWVPEMNLSWSFSKTFSVGVRWDARSFMRASLNAAPKR